MRRLPLTAVAFLVLAAGLPAGAAPSPTGDPWEGRGWTRLRLRPYEREGVPLVYGSFDPTGLWGAVIEEGGPVTGTWFQKGKRVQLVVDEPGRMRVAEIVREDLEKATGAFFYEVVPTRVKAKARLRSHFSGATVLKVSMTVRFLETGGERPVKGKWSLKLTANRTAGPGPGPGPVPDLVEQRQFREVFARMTTGRSSHTSTVLPDGRVLLAGGYDSGLVVLSSAELVNPESETFDRTDRMDFARGNHTATPLPDGSVLVAGGERGGDARGLSSAEIYDPVSEEFRRTSSMSAERSSHTATPLLDGRVLVTGGRSTDGEGYTVWHRSAEVFDPGTETWSRTENDMEMLRAGHRATVLESGVVLVTGGSGTRVAEIYDPRTDRFRTLDARMVEIRSLHGAVRLPNGLVFLTDGGVLWGELFDPASETFTRTDNADSQYRSAAVTFEFRPGEVLIVGGMDFEESFLHGSVEQYIHGYLPRGRYFHLPSFPGHGVYLRDARAFSAWSRLADGRFLITGGLGPAYDEPDLDTAVLFDPGD